MNRNDLYRSFNEVDDEVLLQTELPSAVHRTHSYIRVIAASLALSLCIAGISFLLVPNNEPNSKPSALFALKAYAVDGNLTELGENDGCFNSGHSEFNLFGVDFPLFDFIIEPTNPEYGRDTFWNCGIVISYNGVVCDDLEDDHVSVSYLIPTNGTGARYKYHIWGWFEEETDMTITITDKERGGEVIEEFTVNVCYVAESEAYRLTVTNVKTNHTAYQYQIPDRSQYQLTQEQLNAPTDVLIDYILEYPYLVDLFCSNSPTVNAYAKLCEMFNGLSELENRDDAAAVMLARLSVMTIAEAEDDTLDSMYLQMLLAVPIYSMQLTEEEIDEYSKITGKSLIPAEV